MKNYTLIVDRKRPKPQIRVYLQPCNENQELNYLVSFTGTAQTIIQHAVNIVRGLKLVLTEGTFSVKIESENLERCVYVDEENIYDENFEIIAKTNEAHLFLA